MEIDGQCHCGQVRYTATVDPHNASVCHCTDCQRISGSAFRTTIRLPNSDLHMTGETKIYKKIAASGTERALVFCPTCGTQMLGMPAGDGPKRISLRLGTSNQRAQLPPQRQIWCSSAMPWVEGLADVPKSPAQD